MVDGIGWYGSPPLVTSPNRTKEISNSSLRQCRGQLKRATARKTHEMELKRHLVIN